MTFFEVLDQVAAEYPGIVLMNPNDQRVVPAPVEKVRALAEIGVDDPNFPDTSRILSDLLLARNWNWGYFDKELKYVAIVRTNPATGHQMIVMMEVEEGIPVGRPTLGAAGRREPLEKARTDSFMRLMADVTELKLADVKRLFKASGVETFEEFLGAVEVMGREFAAAGQPLDPANGLASFEIMTRILAHDAADLVLGLGERGIRNLSMLSMHVLNEATEAVESKSGRSPLAMVRPVAKTTYTAIVLDMWPDSPAAIADFFLTDQRRYEALWYPIRAGEITVEQLDRVLGDAAAITKLVNASPSNPHKGVVFGWESTMNGPKMGERRAMSDGLMVRWNPPEAGSSGYLVVENDEGSGLEAYWGAAEDVARDWVGWRDESTANCMASRGGGAAWLESFDVVPSRRGRGEGTRILTTALEMLKKLGVSHVWGFAAPETEELREPLLRLYARHGFSIANGCGGRGNLIVASL